MIRLDYRDSRPIYEQVQGRPAAPDGHGRAWRRDDKLPSVRAWPRSCPSTPTPSSGPMPSWKQEGYVYSVSGKRQRSWRRAVTQNRRPVRRADASGCGRLLEELRNLGLTLEELAALWKEGERPCLRQRTSSRPLTASARSGRRHASACPSGGGLRAGRAATARASPRIIRHLTGVYRPDSGDRAARRASRSGKTRRVKRRDRRHPR